VIMDPVYGYQTVNVEAQMNTTASLLNWTRRMLEVRRRHPAFAVGSLSDLGGSNPTVLSFVLEYSGEPNDGNGGDEDDRTDRGAERSNTVLCVNNLSRFPQPVELDLRRFEGFVPVELMGGNPFPRIGELPYLLTLPGHGFYWFELMPNPEVL